jgi:hypothetical protein
MMPRVLRSVMLGALVGAAAIQVLQAAHSFPDYPVRAADQYTVKADKNGVVVGVEAVEDPKDQQTYFNTKLRQKGFLPVFIVVNNNSSTESFILEKQNVGFGGVSESSAANAGTAFGTEVQQNILKKTLRSATLSPGASAHGFLYIPIPRNGAREKIHLQVPITRAGTHETFILNLYL